MAHLYYAASVPDAVGGLVVIEGAEAHHAAAVARLRSGEQVRIGDGCGRIAECEVVTVSRERIEARIRTVRDVPLSEPRIELVQALAKGGRDELAVQAANELGVDIVCPWQARRSVVRWEGDKARKHLERWRAIAREASKQSLRPRIPEVAPLAVEDALARSSGPGRRLVVLDPEATEPLAEFEPPSEGTIVVVVGPEGGIDAREFAALDAAGARRMRLGPLVLRTSTAGAAALSVLAVRLGRW